MTDTQTINNVEYQLCSVPDSEGLVLEFLDEHQDPFMEIRVDNDDIRWVRFYKNENHTSIKLEDLMKGIKIAQEKVNNVPLE